MIAARPWVKGRKCVDGCGRVTPTPTACRCRECAAVFRDRLDRLCVRQPSLRVVGDGPLRFWVPAWEAAA